MTGNGIFQISLYLIVLTLLVKPLGRYMAKVFQREPCALDRVVGPLERLLYRLCRIDPEHEAGWQEYAGSLLLFNFIGFLAVYGIQRLQGFLPFNPQGFSPVSADSAFNTAISFVTNTNWQGYGGESTMTYLTQMFALTVQNFLSAATGMAVLAALARGFARRMSVTVGSFPVDLVRSTLYVLLPLSLIFSIVLVSQGVVQTFEPYRKVTLLRPVTYETQVTDAAGKTITKTERATHQTVPLGPAAAQVAIKQLGTNGGGFFNANSAHPLENPTPLSNFLEALAILLIPAALCYTFGVIVADTRQGWTIYVAMFLVVASLAFADYALETRGHPAAAALGIDTTATIGNPGGNMEGKELRVGVANSALWAVATTAASSGSVNAMHDSFSPLGGMIPLWLIQLGEVIFGGVGSGLYGMLMFVIVAVFVSGLMVGRTPEYLGKKIQAFEMKMAALVILFPAATVLVGTAVAVVTTAETSATANPGPHGFTEILYAFSSAANNNGSAFAGLSANTPFYNVMLGVAMFIGRFFVIVPVLAAAGSLAAKKQVPAGPGTLPTHTPLFVGLLLGVVLLVGALTFFPALALGPVVEQLMLG